MRIAPPALHDTRPYSSEFDPEIRMSDVSSYALGFPRIGARRELKRALEEFWRGAIDHDALVTVAEALRDGHWQQQRAAGLDRLPVGDFSLYDHVLDAAVRFGIVPERAREGATHPLDVYFR